MKVLQTTMIAGVVFFVSTGISFAADMEDLDITIRMVESNDVHEMENELSLPESVSDTAREHAESEDGRGLTQANESRDREHGNEVAHDGGHENRDQAREDEAEHHDEVRDTRETTHEEADDAREEEQHEHDGEETNTDQPENPDSSDNLNDGTMQ